MEKSGITNRVWFVLLMTLKDLKRRKLQYTLAFIVIFVSILAVLLVDVFVKKGSLIFIKLSEDLQVDAFVTPSVKQTLEGDVIDFKFNFTRIDEMQSEDSHFNLAPRIILDAIDEIKGRDTGYYEKYGGSEEWKNHYDSETGLPTYEDVYGPKKKPYNILRVVNFIKTEKEREMQIGEDYPYGPLEFGRCYIDHGQAFPDEIILFSFNFNFYHLAREYN